MLARALSYAGILLVLGALSYESLILPGAGVTEVEARSERRVVRAVGAGGAALMLLAAALRLWFQATALSEPGEPIVPMLQRLTTTSWGAWVVGQGVLAGVVCLGLASAAHRWERRIPTPLAVVVALAVGATPAFTGHAIVHEHWPAISVLADLVHVVAAGGWIGTLCVLALQIWRRRHADGVNAYAIAVLQTFHPVALWSVVGLGASGAMSTWLRLPQLSVLWTSPYGQLLLLKLALVAVVLAVGAWHAWIARDGTGLRRYRQPSLTLLLEVAVAMAVVCTTALLAGTSPTG